MIQAKDRENHLDEPFYTLANLMPTLCWMANADGWIFWYNSRWYEFTGTTPEQMEGWGWQSVHDPAVLPEVLKCWKTSIETGQRFEMTFPLRSADGSFRPFLTRVMPLHTKDGRVVRWLGVNTDITEERAAVELREQFMAVLGHDLRNPLHAIESGLAVLRKTALDDRAVRVTDMMKSSTARMAALIDDVMDMARGRLGGGLTIIRDAVEIEPVLADVISELKVSQPTRVVQTDIRLNGPVNCDGNRIAQLFSNLLGNAFTYGSDVQPVRVRARDSEGHFELSVINGGAPIPEGDLKRLFQPFFRGAVRDSRQGLGLGLYIAHQVAVAHGGTLTVTSTVQETRFTLLIPSGTAASVLKNGHSPAHDSLN